MPSSALGSFELNGTAGMLMEIRGQVGQKSNGMLTSQVTRGVTALSGMATGEVYDVDPQAYFDIPHQAPAPATPTDPDPKTQDISHGHQSRDHPARAACRHRRSSSRPRAWAA
ncbi:hypothetical protein [Salsipaludibacter albus]|uniref:hypothetical protein n=1 Tax=Salsipaludibacter albus TaxID=2849650 RepID=UPI001EE48407|nr:hypothetical protein [Salsipaludibacter albus]MBY5163137.1 hypothetical protein [Salsipaludibacter albus]